MPPRTLHSLPLLPPARKIILPRRIRTYTFLPKRRYQTTMNVKATTTKKMTKLCQGHSTDAFSSCQLGRWLCPEGLWPTYPFLKGNSWWLWTQLLDLPIGITKLKDPLTYLRVQILISTFHVEHSVLTFSPDGKPATVHVYNHNSITTLSTWLMSSHCLTVVIELL